MVEPCPSCKKEASTIRGRCTNCGFKRDPWAAPPPPPRYVGGGNIWEDLSDFGALLPWLVPAAALVIVALIVSLDVLFAAAAAVIVVPLAIRAALDWW